MFSVALTRVRRFSGTYVSWCLLAIGLVGIPLLYATGAIDIVTVNMLGRYFAFAIVAVGLDLIWGYTGALCLCQAFFFALGGYAMGMYLAHHGPLDQGIPRALFVVSSSVDGITLPWFWKPFYSLPVTVILGLALPAAAAFVVGYLGFASRVRGVFFAILTQALTLGAWLAFCRNDMMLCGTNGLTNFVTIAGFDLTSPNVKLSLYLLTLAALIAVFVLCRRIVNSRFGRVLIAIRDNEDRLRFSGYKPHTYKVAVFALSAAIAGLGGMLYAPQMGIFGPSDMEVKKSILMVIWVAVGGRGTLSGAILGALSVNLIYNFLTTWSPNSWPFVQGGLFIGVVLLFPDGLMSIWRRWVVVPSTAEAEDVSSEEKEVGGERIEAILARIQPLRTTKRPVVPEDLLRLENVSVSFDGFKALDVDSFSLGHRDLRIVIGPNGAGKTTLCDVISGKTRPSTGAVYFGDTEITAMSESDIARMGVGRKFQTPTVFDSLTVYENMELSLLRSESKSEGHDRIMTLLERVRLENNARKQVKYLSHGQRQWLEISMLLLAGPMILLVDEPAAGLTDEETVLTAELLLETQAEHSLLVIEHDMEFVRLLNSWVTVLNDGKIMAEGLMKDIESNEAVIEAYLGR
jgi:urea transport system permease protein